MGTKNEIMGSASPNAKVIDLGGRRVIPGLIDSHMHIIRGGLNYNMEPRWDGVRSLADAMRMLKDQVARTPAPQWVRAVGYTKDTPNPPGDEIVRDARGNPTGLLLAKPNATILYATLAKGPKLPPEYQKNSTRHFMREVNRLGL
ncbi:N-substituted formamide deformylase [Cupriavidus oxalaticus]